MGKRMEVTELVVVSKGYSVSVEADECARENVRDEAEHGGWSRENIRVLGRWSRKAAMMSNDTGAGLGRRTTCLCLSFEC